MIDRLRQLADDLHTCWLWLRSGSLIPTPSDHQVMVTQFNELAAEVAKFRLTIEAMQAEDAGSATFPYGAVLPMCDPTIVAYVDDPSIDPLQAGEQPLTVWLQLQDGDRFTLNKAQFDPECSLFDAPSSNRLSHVKHPAWRGSN